MPEVDSKVIYCRKNQTTEPISFLPFLQGKAINGYLTSFMVNRRRGVKKNHFFGVLLIVNKSVFQEISI